MQMGKPLVLIIGYVWPEPNSSAAGSRMLQLIEFFKAENYTVEFASPAAYSPFAVDLKAIGVKQTAITLNCSSFDDYIRELNPAIVLFDRFMMEEQFGWRVAKYCPDALRLLDTEDLHCLREARRIAYKHQTTVDAGLLQSDLAKREVASIFRCDLTFMISEYEMELLTGTFKVDQTLLFYLPLLVTQTELTALPQREPFASRKDFVFIGNFLHEPNWNCVQVLKKEIWPELRKQLPEAALYIYGAYPSQKVLDFNNPKERFFVKGRAENSFEVIEKARVLLAPIRFGAGIKGKLLDAMVCGTPSVTTTTGAESMSGDLEWNGFIEDNNSRFIEQAAALYANEQLWQEKQNNGLLLLQERYRDVLYRESLKNRITDLLQHVNEHRLGNFIGAMLQHHSLQSTHYMSKWITEKNKDKSHSSE